MNDLALLYLGQGKYAAAEGLVREALAAYEKGNSSSWARYNGESLLGASLAGQKKYAEAEPLLRSGFDGMKQRLGSIPAFNRFRVEETAKQILTLYQDWGKADQAAAWQETLRTAKHSLASAEKPIAGNLR